jgi:hypothetical protein
VPNDNKRLEELLFCLKKNISNSLIKNIYLLNEEFIDLSKYGVSSKKIIQENINERLTYKKAFDYCNGFVKGELWILANADIYFNDTLAKIESYDLDNTLIALLRYELNSSGELNIFTYKDTGKPRDDSQDAWIFKTPIISTTDMDFHLGVGGCDNKIAHLFSKQDYRLLNPCSEIEITHKHAAKNKDWHHKALISPPWLKIKPI